ncbi:unnamed protein product [Peniophora sp. CBMAI 1063]|nr:unnamed protein product [Peniophora sp. CBMAI 1063]
MSDSEIEVTGEDLSPFDASTWIGRGRKLPATLPRGLREHIKSVLLIPDAHRELLPKADASIEALMSWRPPEATPCDDIVWATNIFSPCAPNGAVRHFLDDNYSLPPRQAIEHAHERIGQAILDGMQSFCNARYQNTYLPLWTISFYRALYEVLQRREVALSCSRWLEAALSGCSAVDDAYLLRARDALLRVPWQGNICHDLDVTLFLRLLSDAQISDGLVDSLTQWVICEGRPNTSSCSYFACGIAVWDYLKDKDQSYWTKEGARRVKFMINLEDKLKSVPSPPKFLFPVRLSLGKDSTGLDRGHFLIVEVNPASKTFTLVDSLVGMNTHTIVSKVQHWLHGRVDKRYKHKSESSTLPQGYQRDGTSCGICVASTVASAILDTPPWSHNMRRSERIRWFLRLLGIREEQPVTVTMSQSVGEGVIGNETSEQTFDEAMADTASQTTARATPERVDIIDSDDEFPLFISNPKAAKIMPPVSPRPHNSLKRSLSTREQPDENAASAPHPSTPLSPRKRRRADRMGSSHCPPAEVTPPRICASNFLAVVAEEDGDEAGSSRAHHESGFGDWVKRDAYGNPLARGNSKTQLRDRKRKAEAKAKPASPSKREKFVGKILTLDAEATFDRDDYLRVSHSRCGIPIRCEINRPKNFADHIQRCRGVKATTLIQRPTSAPSLSVLAPPATALPDLANRPCPGLKGECSERLSRYITNSALGGGGARPRYKIVRDLYPEVGHGSLKRLSEAARRIVLTEERAEFLWLVERHLDAVRSSSCTYWVSARMSIALNTLSPCEECIGLVSCHPFQVACSRKGPKEPGNEQFTPDSLQLELKAAADKHGAFKNYRRVLRAWDKGRREGSLLVKFAECLLLDATFPGKDTFVGLIENAVRAQERDEGEKGMQGFKYHPDTIEFGHNLAIISPQAHAAVSKVFKIPSIRAYQQKRAKEPRFPVGIDVSETPRLLKDTLDKLHWSGPVHIADDETKLDAALREYYDVRREAWVLLGTPDLEPPLLPDPQGVQAAIDKGKYVKATQLRLWTAQVPCPGIPVIIIAAMPVDSKVNASDLIAYQERLLACLFDFDINICSMAVDGAGKERNMLRHFDQTAHFHRDQIIPYPPDPSDPTRAFNPRIPYIGPADRPYPVSLMEDPPHCRKTIWANFFAGGRYLTFGDHTVSYRNFYHAWQDGGPLWKRDVIKADRQSDNSARAIFSSANARWMHETRPSETLATVVLVTVLGGLIDAYENKTITTEERIGAVLRAYYVIDIWKLFIKSMGYSSQHQRTTQMLD